MKISLLTCTGMRPEAFKLCEYFVSRQTVKPHEWIVVDDGTPKTICTRGQTYFRGPKDSSPGYNTMRGNMELGLSKVTGDVLFIFEDDDFYFSTYIETLLSLLSHAPLVGLSNSRYYHVGIPGWKLMNNYGHASLAHTAMRGEVVPRLIAAVNTGDLYADSVLWREALFGQTPLVLLANTSLGVGIKGMPGRGGITGSHRDKTDYYIDSKLHKLTSWIGSDAKLYLPFVRPKKGNVENNRPFKKQFV